MSYPFFEDEARINWACTDTCEISDRYLWSCTQNPKDGTKLLSFCSYLCGNRVLDQLDSGTDKYGRPLAEECDQLVQPHGGMNRNGYLSQNANYVADAFSRTNERGTTRAVFDQSNIGCDKYCRVKSGFICPPDNSYDVGTYKIAETVYSSEITYTGGQLLCSDRIQDCIYDGPDVEKGRLHQTPSQKEVSQEFNTVTLYSQYDSERVGVIKRKFDVDSNDRIWAEQCDTCGDVTQGCDKYGRIIPGWVCQNVLSDFGVLKSVCKKLGETNLSWSNLFGQEQSGLTADGWVKNSDNLEQKTLTIDE